MDNIYAEYRITMEDYRRAFYYVSGMQRAIFWRVFLVVVAIAFVCFMAYVWGMMAFTALPLYILGACAVAGLCFVAHTELAIRRVAGKEQGMLGKSMAVEIGGGQLTVNTGQASATHILAGLFYIIETDKLYLVYLDQQQCILVPKRSLGGTQQAQLRDMFRKVLGERFQSKYR